MADGFFVIRLLGNEIEWAHCSLLFGLCEMDAYCCFV